MEVHFEIENSCLLHCRHCSSWATEEGKNKKYEMQHMDDFLQLFPEKNTVFLTGGEPLLHKEVDEILRFLKRNDKEVSIGVFTTGITKRNGKLCGISQEQAFRLADWGLNLSYFSIYSDCAEEHDWMTGVAGSFNMTVQSIQRFVEQGIEVRINLVVTKRNVKKLGQIIKMASALGCTEVRLLKLVNHGRAEGCWADIGLTVQEYKECVRKFACISDGIRITASSSIEILPCRPMEHAQGCQAGSNLAYVTYEGAVFPCASVKNNVKYKIGSIWEGDKLRQYFGRKKMPNPNPLCGG